MKNTKRNTIILLIICLIVLYFVVKDDFADIVDNLILANKWLILLSVLLIVGYWLLRSLALFIVVRKYKKNIKYSKMLHQILITQFFNGITPFATGGEPMQVYMLKKSGVKVAQATNIIVQEFIMYQMALVLMGVVCLGLNFAFDICDVSPFLANLIILGFVINIAIGLICIFVSFSKRFSKFIVKICKRSPAICTFQNYFLILYTNYVLRACPSGRCFQLKLQSLKQKNKSNNKHL